MGISRLCARSVALLAVLASLWAFPTVTASADTPSLTLAEDYLWLGMAADGDPLSFDKARAVLQALPPDAQASPAARALVETIDIQAAMAGEQLLGRFPLARMLAGASSTVHHELWEAPEAEAARVAGIRMLAEASAALSSTGRAAMVVVAPPAFRRLEGEILAIAAESKGMTPMTRRAALEALGNDDGAVKALERGGIETAQRLLAGMGGADVLLVNLRPKRLQGGDALVEAEAHLVFAGARRPPLVFGARGFGFDRRDWVKPLAALNAALALVAVVGVLVLLRRRTLGVQPLAHDVAVAVAAVAFGRLAPLGAFTLAATVVPVPPAGANLPGNAWWPCWIGLVLFVLPMVVWRVAGPRLAAQVPMLASAGRLGLLGLGVGLGAAGYATLPLVLYLQEAAFPVVAATSAAAAAIGYATGRSVDRFDSQDVLWGVPPLLLSLALGAALAAAQPAAVFAVAVLAVGAALAPTLFVRRGVGEAAQGDGLPIAPGAWELPATASVLAEAARFRDGEALWMGVVGEPGAGKSVLIARAIEGWRARGGQLVLLRGNCTPLPDSDAAPPFGPIQQALAGRLEMAFSRGGRNALIGSAIEDAAAMLLGPMAGFLRGEGGAASEADLFVFVAGKLRELALKSPVVLVIDDVQWIDASSRALLAYLRANLHAAGGHGIAVLLAGRPEGESDGLWSDLDIAPVGIDALDENQQRDFLRIAQGLSEPAADWVIAWLGAGTHTPERLEKAVEHLTRHDILAPAGDGLALTPHPHSPPPLPGATERVQDVLAAMPQARNALAAAACIGLRFELSLVAEALNRPVGEVIALMDEVERRTGLVRDDQDSDDIYTFASLQVLDAMRAALGATLRGPLANGVPQIVRHLNGRLADAMSARGPATGEDRLRLALHRYGAGRAQLGLALSACLDAAQSLARMFRYGDARDMVARARECTRTPSDTAAVERAEWAVAAAEAHVRGVAEDSAWVARRGLELLAADPDAQSLLPDVAQSCYDGVRADRTLLEETARLGALMERGEGEIAAEGLHLMALAAPRDGSDFRVDTLRRALAAAERAGVVSARARIANSLAEELSAAPAAREEAATLFQLSLDLKNQADIRDLPGLARTHGGMGRLAFFGNPPDHVAAREHFQQDLRLSEQIGDQRGISKMESLLGAVARAEGRLDEAQAHYRRSIAQNVDQLDVCLSYAGLLACATAKGDRQGFAAIAAEAGRRDFADVPIFARDELAKALAAEVPA